MLKKLALTVTACSVMGMYGAAHAQANSDRLSWNADGSLTIHSVVQTPNSCYSAGDAAAGTPAGERPIRNAVSVIYPLKVRTGPCLMVITPVKFTITVKVPSDSQAVIVYTIDPSQKSVVARALALPPKPRLNE